VKGIILAAGRGSRLGTLTADRPKCLVELAGRSLLDRQRAALTAAGVVDLAVVTGYRAGLLAGRDLPLLHNDRWAETNMVGSLLVASAVLAAEPCVVSYSDIVYSAETVARLLAAPGQLAIAYDPSWAELWSRRFDDPIEDAETFRLAGDGTLAEIGARPTTVAEVQGQYMGLLRFTPLAWRAVDRVLGSLTGAEVDRLDMTTLLAALIRAGEPIGAVPVAGGWAEVDSAADLEVATELVGRRELAFEEVSG
jgi:choline kinase